MDGVESGDSWQPAVSVVIASYNSGRTIGACLEALERQTRRDFEVIVVDSSEDDSVERAVERRGARLIRVNGRRFPGDARNLGVRAARGSVIAFVDADCYAEPDWMERIGEHAAAQIVSGSVAAANPESWIGWAAFFCEFSPWVSTGEPRHLPDAPTCNLAIRREAFERWGPFIEGSYCSDTVFHWRARRDGCRPWFVPRIQVRHQNLTSLSSFLRKQWMHGRTFARVRVRELGLSRVECAARAVSGPALPLLLFGRRTLQVAKADGLLIRFLAVAPLVFAGLAIWSAGEMAGYAEAVLPGRRRP